MPEWERRMLESSLVLIFVASVWELMFDPTVQKQLL
jgi:hypothetical protein